MSNETQRVIEGAYKILSSEERWTKGALARDISDVDVDNHSSRARKFCTLGSIRMATSATRAGKQFEDKAIRNLNIVLGWEFISHFNDSPTTTHADILALLRKAHKLAGDGLPEVVE